MPATDDASFVTRFAPSPTGRLHLGHAYSALLAHAAARAAGGRFLLRIEDIDRGRSRPEHERAMLDELRWLGLEWETPVRRQSDHFADYAAALDRLAAAALVYPCFCTRREIRAEIAASPAAPHGPDGPLYPGTCRNLPAEVRTARVADGAPYALRLDVGKALARVGRPLSWTDAEAGPQTAAADRFGDVVVARKEVPTSYHLAVTVDDASQGVTEVIRGRDLFHSTHVHRLLQALLGLPTPRYRHHRLITDDRGNRLAKRAGAPTLAALRADGAEPAEIRRLVGL